MVAPGSDGLNQGPVDCIRSTTDLPLMAFYLMNGLELVKVERHPEKFDCVIFVFRDPESKAEELRYAWANSVARDFDNAMRTLKKVCQEMRRDRRKQRRRDRRRGNGPQ